MLLVDKARFPRDKPCGGGLTMRAVRQCPVDPSPVVEEEVDVRRAALPLRRRRRAPRARAPVIRMTQRRRLDAFLLDAARERGVEVREGDDRSTVDDEPPADVVVGADGANGTTARAVGLGDGIVHGVAYEGNVPYGVVSTRALRAARGRRARRHPRRLRLGLPEGRPRRTSASAPGRAKGRSIREHLAPRLRGARPRARRSSRSCAATGCRCAGRDAGSPASARSSSATRPG